MMPNIDRDDENATRYEMPKPDIDEQREHQKQRTAFVRSNIERRAFLQSELDKEEAILATLEAYKRIIEAAEVPKPVAELPNNIDGGMEPAPWELGYVSTQDYDNLLAAYHKALAERDAALLKVDGLKQHALKYIDPILASDQMPKDAEDFVDNRLAMHGERHSALVGIYPSHMMMILNALKALRTRLFKSNKRAETAERQLAELQAKHDALVKDDAEYRQLALSVASHLMKALSHPTPPTEEQWTQIALLARAYSERIDSAMSAVALRREGE